MRPQPGFAGFQDAERHVSVVIAELPTAAYERLAETLFGKDPPGATKVTRESFPFNSGIGYLHTARIVENGATIRRWVLIATPAATGDELIKFAVVINVMVPEAASDAYTEQAVRKMLASVSFRPPPIEERLGLIPFKLGDLAGFRVLQVLPEGLDPHRRCEQ